MKAKLVVVGGEISQAEFDLALPAVIGRGRDVTLTLSHPLVSRRHCEILESDGRLMVRDLGSLNGTYIGNVRIREELLQPGDLLTVGTITFRAVYGGAKDAPAAENYDADAPTVGKTDDTLGQPATGTVVDLSMRKSEDI